MRSQSHDGRVQIDDQPRQLPAGGARARERLTRALSALRPHGLTCRRPGPRDLAESGAVEALEQPPTRRVRRHRPEQLSLIRQHRHVGDRGPTVGHRHRHIDQQPTRIMTSRGLRRPASASANCAVSVVRSATSASSRDPASDTTPSPSAAAVTFGLVVVACTSKVLLHPADPRLQQSQLPW
jgi:hypothetical protein